MRKIIGVGETILDVIFKNGQPTQANPGGSVFNAMVSLGRLGLRPYFISEVGKDMVGELIISFMERNNIETRYIERFCDGSSPVALAFLDENNNAKYQFFTNYPGKRMDVAFPKIEPDDILIFGSIFALRPELRTRMVELLDYAREREAIIYYDPNFRSPHAHEKVRLLPTILENMEYADIVRGSDEDFLNIFNLSDPQKIYHEKVSYYCRNFVYTRGEKGVHLFTKTTESHFDVKPITPVSTIGAGDNFNAGLLFGLLRNGITKKQIDQLTCHQWANIIASGIDFSSEICGSFDNYISEVFAQQYLNQSK